MRIVLHAGLHKSATTSTQTAWGNAWSEPGSTWYPRRPGTSPGHAYLVRPYLRAFTEREDPDLVLVSLTTRAHRDDLRDVVAQAVSEGVETLVLSSEDLARVHTADVSDLAAILGAHDVEVLLTATRPVHRWCSNWQTFVRRGLDATPRRVARSLERVAALTPGRLETLAGTWPAARVAIRLVETDPPDPGLPRDLASLMGLPEPTGSPSSGAHNASLGVDVDVVRRLNAADRGLGMARGGSERLAELRGDGFAYRPRGAVEGEEFQVSSTAWEAARVERDFLAALAPDGPVELHDPGGLLDRWLDPTPPAWYDDVAREEAVVPAIDETVDRGELLWRLRQERAAYQDLLERSEQQVQLLRRRLRKRNARIAELEGP